MMMLITVLIGSHKLPGLNLWNSLYGQQHEILFRHPRGDILTYSLMLLWTVLSAGNRQRNQLHGGRTNLGKFVS